MFCIFSLTKLLEQTFTFGLRFDGIDAFDHRMQYLMQFRGNIICANFSVKLSNA